MALTRDQMQAVVVSRTGRSDKTADIQTWMGLGLSEMIRRHDWQTLREEASLSIVEDDSSKALPSGSVRLIEARLMNGELSRKIDVWPRAMVVEKWPKVDEVSTGQPVVGYVLDGTLHFVPPSDGEYTIKVTVIKDASFANGSATSPIEGSDAALMAYATWQIMAQIEKFQAANYWQGQFEQEVARLVQSDERRPEIDWAGQPLGRETGPTVTKPWLDPFEGHKGSGF